MHKSFCPLCKNRTVDDGRSSFCSMCIADEKKNSREMDKIYMGKKRDETIKERSKHAYYLKFGDSSASILNSSDTKATLPYIATRGNNCTFVHSSNFDIGATPITLGPDIYDSDLLLLEKRKGNSSAPFVYINGEFHRTMQNGQNHNSADSPRNLSLDAGLRQRMGKRKDAKHRKESKHGKNTSKKVVHRDPSSDSEEKAVKKRRSRHHHPRKNKNKSKKPTESSDYSFSDSESESDDDDRNEKKCRKKKRNHKKRAADAKKKKYNRNGLVDSSDESSSSSAHSDSDSDSSVTVNSVTQRPRGKREKSYGKKSKKGKKGRAPSDSDSDGEYSSSSPSVSVSDSSSSQLSSSSESSDDDDNRKTRERKKQHHKSNKNSKNGNYYDNDCSSDTDDDDDENDNNRKNSHGKSNKKKRTDDNKKHRKKKNGNSKRESENTGLTKEDVSQISSVPKDAFLPSISTTPNSYPPPLPLPPPIGPEQEGGGEDRNGRNGGKKNGTKGTGAVNDHNRNSSNSYGYADSGEHNKNNSTPRSVNNNGFNGYNYTTEVVKPLGPASDAPFDHYNQSGASNPSYRSNNYSLNHILNKSTQTGGSGSDDGGSEDRSAHMDPFASRQSNHKASQTGEVGDLGGAAAAAAGERSGKRRHSYMNERRLSGGMQHPDNFDHPRGDTALCDPPTSSSAVPNELSNRHSGARSVGDSSLGGGDLEDVADRVLDVLRGRLNNRTASTRGDDSLLQRQRRSVNKMTSTTEDHDAAAAERDRELREQEAAEQRRRDEEEAAEQRRLQELEEKERKQREQEAAEQRRREEALEKRRLQLAAEAAERAAARLAIAVSELRMEEEGARASLYNDEADEREELEHHQAKALEEARAEAALLQQLREREQRMKLRDHLIQEQRALFHKEAQAREAIFEEENDARDELDQDFLDGMDEAEAAQLARLDNEVQLEEGVHELLIEEAAARQELVAAQADALAAMRGNRDREGERRAHESSAKAQASFLKALQTLLRNETDARRSCEEDEDAAREDVFADHDEALADLLEAEDAMRQQEEDEANAIAAAEEADRLRILEQERKRAHERYSTAVARLQEEEARAREDLVARMEAELLEKIEVMEGEYEASKGAQAERQAREAAQKQYQIKVKKEKLGPSRYSRLIPGQEVTNTEDGKLKLLNDPAVDAVEERARQRKREDMLRRKRTEDELRRQQEIAAAAHMNGSGGRPTKKTTTTPYGSPIPRKPAGSSKRTSAKGHASDQSESTPTSAAAAPALNPAAVRKRYSTFAEPEGPDPNPRRGKGGKGGAAAGGDLDLDLKGQHVGTPARSRSRASSLASIGVPSGGAMVFAPSAVTPLKDRDRRLSEAMDVYVKNIAFQEDDAPAAGEVSDVDYEDRDY